MSAPGHVFHLSHSIRSEHAYPLSRPDDDNSDREPRALDQVTTYLTLHHGDLAVTVVRGPSLVTVLPRSLSGLRLDLSLERERLSCRVVTHNMEVVRVVSIELGDMEHLGRTVTDILGGEDRLCPGLEGLGEQELDPVLERLSREDITQLLIERFGGRLVYRARSCGFLITSKEQVCPYCLVLSYNLKETYFPSFLDDKSSVKTRRRPLGSRTKTKPPSLRLVMDIESTTQSMSTLPEDGDGVDEPDIFTDGEEDPMEEEQKLLALAVETKVSEYKQIARGCKDQDVVCPVCVKAFKDKTELKIHFKKHAGWFL